MLWELTGYWLLLFVGFFPQSLRPHDTVAYIGDSLDSVYTIAWTGRQVFTDPLNLFDVNVLHPHRQALALFGHRILLGVLAAPVAWLSANPVLAYNVTFLLSFPLSGLAAYLLGRELTGRHDAAWVAGLIYGFAPYRIDHLPQVQVLSWYWVPVILLALHRFVRDGRTRWLVLLGVAYLFQGLSNGYLFLFVCLLDKLIAHLDSTTP